MRPAQRSIRRPSQISAKLLEQAPDSTEERGAGDQDQDQFVSFIDRLFPISDRE